MKKRRFLIFPLVAFFLLSNSVQAAPSVSASSACVIDAASGRVIYEKNAYEKRGMASTTKIMTAIVALEHGDAEAVITVSENAANTEGSSVWLEAGEKMKLSDLLYGLMLASGNDAAVAIAEGVGGSVEQFVALMNEKTKEIGAHDTSFENPNGLTAENHYTTAYDLAQITRYAMQNKVFREIVATKTKTIPWENSQWDRTLTNHNKLLDSYEGCDGVKTGYTKACGRCLVSTAERNGARFICVTLNDPNDWADHQNLLNFSFESYPATSILEKGKVMGQFPVPESEYMVDAITEQEFILPLSSEEKEKISFDVEINELTLPIKAGETIGKVTALLEDKSLGEVNLICEQDYEAVPENEFWEQFNLLLKLFFTRE